MSTQTILMALNIWGLAAYGTAAIAYHILAPWHESRVGRWYMAQLVVIAASLALILLNQILGYIGYPALPFVIYTLLAVVGTGTAITVATTQIKKRLTDTAEMELIPTTLDNTAEEVQPPAAPKPPEGNTP